MLDLTNPSTKETALLELSKKRESFPELAPYLWHSFGTMAALLQEIVSIYPMLQPPSLTAHASNRVCNALALLQCVASHPETRSLFLQGAGASARAAKGGSRHRQTLVGTLSACLPPRRDAATLPGGGPAQRSSPPHPPTPPAHHPAAHIPLFLYPFLNTASKTRPFEYLRLTSLGVIGALVKVDDTEVGAAAALAGLPRQRTTSSARGGEGRQHAQPCCCTSFFPLSIAAPTHPPPHTHTLHPPRSSTSCCPLRLSRSACARWRRGQSCPRRWPPLSCRRSCWTAWASPTSAPPPSVFSPSARCSPPWLLAWRSSLPCACSSTLCGATCGSGARGWGGGSGVGVEGSSHRCVPWVLRRLLLPLAAGWLLPPPDARPPPHCLMRSQRQPARARGAAAVPARPAAQPSGHGVPEGRPHHPPRAGAVAHQRGARG